MSISRLRDIPGIGVDRVGDAADAASDPEILRLENLDTDLRPPAIAIETTRAAIEEDSANSYLPFQGHLSLREAAARHVGRIAGRTYDAHDNCVSVAGGLNGILNVLLATVEPGQEVVLCDPIYAGLVNRVRLAGGIPRFVRAHPSDYGWIVDPEEVVGAIGPNTAALLMMSPAMPSGALMTEKHWQALALLSRTMMCGSSTTPPWSASVLTAGRPYIRPQLTNCSLEPLQSARHQKSCA